MTTNRTIQLKTDITAGNFDKDLLITAFSGTESLSALFEFSIIAKSKVPDIDLEKLLGSPVAVVVSGKEAIPDRYFHGLVSHIGSSGWEDRHATFHITIKPWLWLLQKTTDCRIFQQKSVIDVVGDIFKENGFSDFRFDISAKYLPVNYCVQYRESDFNFICRLLEQEGIYFYFEHEENKHTLVLADAPSSHKSIKGCESVPYFPPGSVVREDQHIEQWGYQMHVRSGSFALNAFDFTKPKAGLTANHSLTRKHKFNDFEIYDYPGKYTERDRGNNYANIRIEQLHSQSALSAGSGNATGIHPGGLFKLDNHPQSECNQEYLVVECNYHASANVYESGDNTETSFTNHFHCIPSKVQFRPEPMTPRPVISGPQTGIVVGPSGEEIWTDEYGRIKVQFHWDRYGKSDENSSCWIRVSQLWAGSNWGAIHLPRIGQEVIVEFMEGDPDAPIVTGRTYNADNMPPYALPENQTQSGIKSRSSKKGTADSFNEIRFEDLKGNELLTIHAEKNQSIEVENDEKLWVGHDRRKAVDNDEATEIGNNRTESVGKDESITIGNNRNESVAKNESITIGESRTEDVGKDENVTIGSNRKTTIGKEETLVVSDGRGTQIGKDDILDVGKKLTIQAGDEITLKTGSAEIVMKKSGDITIKGKNINLKGSGNISIKGSKVLSN
ncbi:Actin cross-linking toxin VgrG1 [BD1-7 clade bacterium]|uniref:Actin cross-linking toxin VgrG1 n=1 Tax=BD1-7 clade bacterium TaxID=2029982 RepID=A0A5S9QFG2_9GAMM|nr:Actin cross-linking toxin VgrG1 [BD1-7 clade bacterium]CAA0116145.1 Actin cross-linking toxin VgrG1 [BD1-7 clade bacterium]CAA0119813.1 Actin cross-linking toxin VgrG1 [BD1-7 clade bacterium]